MAAENTAEEKRRRRRRGAEAEEAEVAEEMELAEGKGRITPGRRNKEEEVQGNAFTRPFINFFNYLQEVRNELDKVSWPTREETIRLTRIVLLVTVVSSLVLGGLSFLAGEVIRLGLNTPAIIVALFVAMVAGAVWYMRRSNPTRSGY